MKKWVRQLAIGTVALFTFGIISPSHEIWTDLRKDHDTDDYERREAAAIEYSLNLPKRDVPVTDLLQHARNVSYEKFGTKIGPKIQADFDRHIFPEMASVLKKTYALDTVDRTALAITEQPAGNYGERIFNVYDKETGDELLYFHVRTEKRPQEGYYYNFHYHSFADDFAVHHSLGDIYWSKDTPPRWLS